MSLEQAIKDLQAAVEANTAAQLKAGGGTSTAADTKGKGAAAGKGKETPAAYTPQRTKDEMLAALTEMKDALGLPETKKVIKEVGKKDRMGEIEDPATIDLVYEAAKKAMEAAANKGGDDGL